MRSTSPRNNSPPRPPRQPSQSAIGANKSSSPNMKRNQPRPPPATRSGARNVHRLPRVNRILVHLAYVVSCSSPRLSPHHPSRVCRLMGSRASRLRLSCCCHHIASLASVVTSSLSRPSSHRLIVSLASIFSSPLSRQSLSHAPVVSSPLSRLSSRRFLDCRPIVSLASLVSSSPSRLSSNRLSPVVSSSLSRRASRRLFRV